MLWERAAGDDLGSMLLQYTAQNSGEPLPFSQPYAQNPSLAAFLLNTVLKFFQTWLEVRQYYLIRSAFDFDSLDM